MKIWVFFSVIKLDCPLCLSWSFYLQLEMRLAVRFKPSTAPHHCFSKHQHSVGKKNILLKFHLTMVDSASKGSLNIQR
ncbi:hypothetical protein V6Z12_D07G202300 [Gossypium hirsutum]